MSYTHLPCIPSGRFSCKIHISLGSKELRYRNVSLSQSCFRVNYKILFIRFALLVDYPLWVIVVGRAPCWDVPSLWLEYQDLNRHSLPCPLKLLPLLFWSRWDDWNWSPGTYLYVWVFCILRLQYLPPWGLGKVSKRGCLLLVRLLYSKFYVRVNGI